MVKAAEEEARLWQEKELEKAKQRREAEERERVVATQQKEVDSMLEDERNKAWRVSKVAGWSEGHDFRAENVVQSMTEESSGSWTLSHCSTRMLAPIVCRQRLDSLHR
jgi:hypothetical protein